jgi:uncharacterized glyoxalase superfamily protein PhnB
MAGWGVIPALRFADLNEGVRFYTEVLGFSVRRAEEGNVSVTFGDANLMLEAPVDFYGPVYNAAIRERLGVAGPAALYIEAEDLQGLWERVSAAGVPVVDPLAERPWGQAEFTIEDPAGNWLTFWNSSTAG